MKDWQYLSMITKNCGPKDRKFRPKLKGLTSDPRYKIFDKEVDPEETVAFFKELYKTKD